MFNRAKGPAQKANTALEGQTFRGGYSRGIGMLQSDALLGCAQDNSKFTACFSKTVHWKLEDVIDVGRCVA